MWSDLLGKEIDLQEKSLLTNVIWQTHKMIFNSSEKKQIVGNHLQEEVTEKFSYQAIEDF